MILKKFTKSKPLFVFIIFSIAIFFCLNFTIKNGMSKETEEKTEGMKLVIKTHPESIAKGKALFDSKCYFCHSANSTETKAGPGLLGVLKHSKLPESRKPATPDNIANQLKNPYKNMPSFAYLSDDDVLNIIAFLNTL